MINIKAIIKYTILTNAIAVLMSCAATSTVIEHRNLESKTELRPTIFLDPVAQNEKTIFIVVKNTSQESITIEKPLVQAVSAHGYRIVNNMNQAHYMLQANIREVGKMSRSASQNALGGGFGSALSGAVTGAALGSLGSSNTVIGGGIAGGIVGLAADSLVKSVNYTMITDVQISERVGKGVVKELFDSSLENGSASRTYQSSSKLSDYKRYRTRIVSNAEKVNLSFAQAKPALEQGLIKTLAGIF